jgi:hypothetical protein
MPNVNSYRKNPKNGVDVTAVVPKAVPEETVLTSGIEVTIDVHGGMYLNLIYATASVTVSACSVAYYYEEVLLEPAITSITDSNVSIAPTLENTRRNATKAVCTVTFTGGTCRLVKFPPTGE